MGGNLERRAVLGGYGLIAVVSALTVLTRSNRLWHLLSTPPRDENAVFSADALYLEFLRLRVLFGIAALPLVAMTAAASSASESFMRRWQSSSFALVAAGTATVLISTKSTISSGFFGFAPNTSIVYQPSGGTTWTVGLGVTLALVGML